MPQRTWEWSTQISFPVDRIVRLGVGTELWHWDVSAYDSANAIRAALKHANRPADDDSVLVEAVDSLLSDVLDAVGGIEGAHVRLKVALVKAQEVHDRTVADNPGFAPLTGHYDASTETAWYALEEMLIWARTLGDRLKRKSVVTGQRAKQGLIPALAPGVLQTTVVNARSSLLNDGLQEACRLSQLSLHMQPSQSGSRMALVRSGRVVLRFPDSSTGLVDHRIQLTYKDGRDGETFADGLMEAVGRFMDELIDSFKTHGPTRFKRT